MPHNNSLPATETCPRTRQDVLGRTPPSLEAVSCPLGMSCEQWQYAVSAGWLGMTDTAAARLGYVAPWKLAVSRRPKERGDPPGRNSQAALQSRTSTQPANESVAWGRAGRRILRPGGALRLHVCGSRPTAMSRASRVPQPHCVSARKGRSGTSDWSGGAQTFVAQWPDTRSTNGAERRERGLWHLQTTKFPYRFVP